MQEQNKLASLSINANVNLHLEIETDAKMNNTDIILFLKRRKILNYCYNFIIIISLTTNLVYLQKNQLINL